MRLTLLLIFVPAFITLGCKEATVSDSAGTGKTSTILSLDNFDVLGAFERDFQVADNLPVPILPPPLRATDVSINLKTGSASVIFEGDMAVACEPSLATLALLQNALKTVEIVRTQYSTIDPYASALPEPFEGVYVTSAGAAKILGWYNNGDEHRYKDETSEKKVLGLLGAYVTDCRALLSKGPIEPDLN